MADTSTGVPSAAQLITDLDALASMFKGSWQSDGIGASTETTTKAALAKVAESKILGDGFSNYGIGNPALQSTQKAGLANLRAYARYDSFWSQVGRDLVLPVQAAVAGNLPSGWKFTGANQTQPLDAYLLYLNAANASVPATPASAGTLTGTTVAGGGLGTVASGSAPRVVHCLVSTSGDWFVSLPSPEATQVALTGSQNAWIYQIAGTVPANIAYVLIFRGVPGGSTGTYYLDQRVAVTPTASYVPITISQPDTLLRKDWTPPSWLQCPMMPETAAIFALTFAASGGNAANPLVYTSGKQLSPENVALGPSNGFLAAGNPAQTGIFGIRVVGTGFTAGAIAAANNAASNTQGFTGTGGAANIVQARVTSVLNAAGTSAITYSYYDAGHGYGSVQSATSGAATFTGTGVGSVAIYTIPAGRIVIAVTAETPSGMASGTYLIEGLAPRAY